jgi:hypothetical protein
VAACVTRTKGAAGYVSAAASTAGVKTLESNSGAENLPRLNTAAKIRLSVGVFILGFLNSKTRARTSTSWSPQCV